ncbi:hypothetical protein [Lacinutrix sp. Bg11-31]|uniref:hypothetical protein n=1 Tax=Lacinutrix sp. Bg11-31 TaxID=2057808 RepID=UPI000C304F59|nr:hypothetical protein [Lacinutrix sp. Bg11-31]AUC80948.1 hypothetical protein CW733_01880 [Lacinutrix sp. Bg11-31]
MNKEKIEFAKLFSNCKKKAITSVRECYYPECKTQSINSHILQKNGILSSIAPKKHLWELGINHYKSPPFRFERNGLNQIFSFNCFCEKHDNSLFKKIESEVIDFSDYETCLLFTLRTIYNEIFRKEVNSKTFECLIQEKDGSYNNAHFRETLRQEKLGLDDLKLLENDIWSDFNNKTQSYIFNNRKIKRAEICLSSFYTYDTSIEIENYYYKFGKDMERTSEIYINSFPFEKHSILLMGYHKRDENKLKGYFNTFFKENEKKVQRRITNLMLFNCETWVVSDNFHKSKIEGIEDLYATAVTYTGNNKNERKTFDLNFFNEDFKTKFQQWKNNNVG